MRKRAPIDYVAATQTRRPLLVLLDGLDLLPDTIPAAQIIDEACNYAGPRACHFMLSSRPIDALDHILFELGQVQRITLGALSAAARDTWLEQHCSQSTRSRYESLCECAADVRSLLDVPLLFAMVASICLDETNDTHAFTCDAYPGIPGIFDGFLQYIVQRAVHDRRLPNGTCFTEVSPVFEGVCLAAARAGRRDRIPRERISEFVRESDFPGETLSSDERGQAWNAALDIALKAGRGLRCHWAR